ncbi:peptidoglycan DD-metalloendopeptidase family protein [Microbacterium sp. AG238]|uniref:peptidoglycan DD-metalloendopeptidase family protein n=1 Tax=Microbacterium sp. AG238 TaxID=2183994 RepID=UPI000E743E03|nr:peptidoglycan DD-metalloendopeptidase family protein [Microbacterium sp. AG238]RKE60472.1 peptidase M23-like protein [Microbacterium sp. AG238]
MNWRVFYAVSMWTNRFWEWGPFYTIARAPWGGGFHIALDIGTGRRAVNVPALHPGTVALVSKTTSMGWVIYIDTGLPGARRYHVYCHMSGDRLPRRGQWIDRNQRVGRLAQFGANVRFDHVDYGGTAWDGIHLHLVMTDRIGGAHLISTGAAYANPETFIREALAGTSAGGGSRPFDPEEDDMPSEDWLKQLGADIVDQVTDKVTRRVGDHTLMPGAGYTYDAAAWPVLNDIRRGVINFPGAEYLMGPALANQGHMILAAIVQLAAVVDPDGDGHQGLDIQALILESEERTKAFYVEQQNAQLATLRETLVNTLGTIEGVTLDTIADGVDLAFSRAFPQPAPAAAPVEVSG